MSHIKPNKLGKPSKEKFFAVVAAGAFALSGVASANAKTNTNPSTGGATAPTTEATPQYGPTAENPQVSQIARRVQAAIRYHRTLHFDPTIKAYGLPDGPEGGVARVVTAPIKMGGRYVGVEPLSSNGKRVEVTVLKKDATAAPNGDALIDLPTQTKPGWGKADPTLPHKGVLDFDPKTLEFNLPFSDGASGGAGVVLDIGRVEVDKGGPGVVA